MSEELGKTSGKKVAAVATTAVVLTGVVGGTVFMMNGDKDELAPGEDKDIVGIEDSDGTDSENNIEGNDEEDESIFDRDEIVAGLDDEEEADVVALVEDLKGTKGEEILAEQDIEGDFTGVEKDKVLASVTSKGKEENKKASDKLAEDNSSLWAGLEDKKDTVIDVETPTEKPSDKPVDKPSETPKPVEPPKEDKPTEERPGGSGNEGGNNGGDTGGSEKPTEPKPEEPKPEEPKPDPVVVAKDNLRDILSNYGSISKGDYTEGSYDRYSNARTSARIQINSSTATVEGLNDAGKNIRDTFGKLVSVKGLKELVTEDVRAGDYTVTSYGNYKESLDSGLKVLDTYSPTLNTVNIAEQNIKDSKKGLVSVVELRGIVEKNEDISAKGYTSYSYDKYLSVLDEAKKVLNKVDATKKELKNAGILLEDTVKGLISTVELGEVIAEYSEIYKDDYTAGTYGKLQKELDYALDVLIDGYASKEDIQIAIDKLHEAKEGLVSIIELGDIIKTYSDIEGTGYTQGSFDKLKKAIDSAKEILADDNASRYSVEIAIDNIIDKYESLISIVELQETINDYLAIEGTGYTQGSFDELESAIYRALTVLDDGDASEEDIAEVLKGMEDAKGNLVSNKELADVLRDLENLSGVGIDEGDYTSGTYTNLLNAIDAAKGVLGDGEVTAEQIQDAIEGIELAKDGLVSIVGLASKVAEYGVIESDNYTIGSFKKLQDTINEAKEMLLDGNITEEEINNIITELETAKDGLVDISELKDLISEYESLDKDNYREDGWSLYNEAYEIARLVVANPNISGEVVDQAIVTLQDAKGALEEYLGLDELEVIYGEFTEIDKGDFSGLTWGEFEDRLLEAKAVLDGEEDYSKKQVEELYYELQAAKDDLISIKVLNGHIEEAESILAGGNLSTDYTIQLQGLVDEYTTVKDGTKEDIVGLSSSLAELLSNVEYDTDGLEGIKDTLEGLNVGVEDSKENYEGSKELYTQAYNDLSNINESILVLQGKDFLTESESVEYDNLITEFNAGKLHLDNVIRDITTLEGVYGDVLENLVNELEGLSENVKEELTNLYGEGLVKSTGDLLEYIDILGGNNWDTITLTGDKPPLESDLDEDEGNDESVGDEGTTGDEDGDIGIDEGTDGNEENLGDGEGTEADLDKETSEDTESELEEGTGEGTGEDLDGTEEEEE